MNNEASLRQARQSRRNSAQLSVAESERSEGRKKSVETEGRKKSVDPEGRKKSVEPEGRRKSIEPEARKKSEPKGRRQSESEGQSTKSKGKSDQKVLIAQNSNEGKASQFSGKSKITPLEARNYGPTLELLKDIDRIFIKPTREISDIQVGTNFRDFYFLFDKNGKRMYTASEESSTVSLCFLGHGRPFTVTYSNEKGGIVLISKRHYTYTLWWWGGICYGNRVEILDANETILGHINEIRSCTPNYIITGRNGDKKFQLLGPNKWNASPCHVNEMKFKLISSKGKEVGIISKIWPNNEVNEEAFSSDQLFGIKFPIEMSPEKKALLVGSIFLIYFQYFEDHHGNLCSGMALTITLVGFLIVILVVLAGLNLL